MPRNPFLDQVPVQEFPLTSYYLQSKLKEASISSSYALTASYAETASFASTASFALTASFVNTASTNAFIQGGNSFGAQATLGTNDNQSLVFETSGSTRMFISSSGNVGIGTSDPSQRLHVLGNIIGQDNTSNASSKSFSLLQGHYTNAEESFSLFSSVSNPTQNILWIGGGNANFNTATDIRFFTAVNSTTLTGTERMRIAVDGNVGIGVTSPTAKLQVRGSGTTSATTALRVENSNASASLVVLDNSNVGIGTVTPSSSLHVLGQNTVASSSFLVQNSSGQTLISALNNRTVSINDTNAVGGNTSIGTTNGTITLVQGFNNTILGNSLTFYSGGSASTIQGFNTNPGIAIGYTQTTVNPNPGTGLAIRGTVTTSGSGVLFVTGSSNTRLLTLSSETNPNAFVVSGSGNVGIGTTTPNARLNVSGSTTITGSLSVTQGITGSLFGTASWATNALTSSYLNTLNQDLTFNGNLTLNGTASISTLVVNQTQYSSGSNQLGDAIDDTQTLFGSVIIPTGSLIVTGSVTLTSIFRKTDTSGNSLFLINSNGSTSIKSDANDIFLIKNQNDIPLFTVSQSGIVVFSTQSVELTGSAPNGGIYFTSQSFYIGLD
jgi:hypothetical protein